MRRIQSRASGPSRRAGGQRRRPRHCGPSERIELSLRRRPARRHRRRYTGRGPRPAAGSTGDARTGSVGGLLFDAAWTETDQPDTPLPSINLTGSAGGTPIALQAVLRPGPRGGSFGLRRRNRTGRRPRRGRRGPRRRRRPRRPQRRLRRGHLRRCPHEGVCRRRLQPKTRRHRPRHLQRDAVHVDVTRQRRSDPLHITGQYHGPVELLTVLLTALLSFDS